MINFINKLQNSSDINEKELGNNISSFNFKRDVFFSSRWNDLNKIARGLFINTKTNEIVARSYPKFFNFEEGNNTIEWLKNNLKFPISVYQKYNGYLGIVSYDKKDNNFFIATKSTNQGDYANWFKEIFFQHLNKYNITEKLKIFLKNNKCSLIFEVIDIINDPNIIEYYNNKLVLLDIIDNQLDFYNHPYDELVHFASDFYFEVKNKEYEIYNFNELEQRLLLNCNRTDIEGFVIQDSNRYMFKLKTPFYKHWKRLRSLKDKFVRKREKGEKLFLDNQSEQDFIDYCSKYSNDELKFKSIIELRNEMIK